MPKAAGKGVAVDAPNDRLSKLGHLQKKLGECMPAVVVLERRLLASEAAEVGSGAEGAVAATGEDDD